VFVLNNKEDVLVLFRMTLYKKSQEELEEFSRDVYEAFQAIGVTSDMIHRRRHNYLLWETVDTTGSQLQGDPMSYFIVGSQVEGSTTIGMLSDTDFTCRYDNYQVVLKLGTWQTGKINLLAFKDETTPPQFYKLCRLQPTPDGRQEYMRDPDHETDVVDGQGRVLVCNTMLDNVIKRAYEALGEGEVVKHGPSRSWSDKCDHVYALPCHDLPEEYESFFTRSRPGHWPKSETLEYARQCQVFFIPQGHPHSPLNEHKLQWRLSTSLTERKLMFDFTEEQMLVFILLKMLKKEYCKLKIGDDFSTFHIKTAMMFCIESYPPEIWCIGNIVKCATYCINILIQWTQDNVCPHFTMGGVNLFDGKLSEPDIRELETFLISLREHITENICELKMDLFGVKVLQKVLAKESNIKHQTEILQEITWNIRSTQLVAVKHICLQLSKMDVNNAVCFMFNHVKNLRRLQSEGSDLQPEVANMLLPFLHGILASIKASCITTDQPVTQDIIDLYQHSFECDLMSGKLKYASMLYCRGQYDQAADMLNHCEGLLGPDVAHYCGCHGRRYDYLPDTFLRTCLNTSTVELWKTSSTSCVMFCKHELPCVPEHLQHEMYRTQTQKDMKERNALHIWMDLVVIDCMPFLIYLQYLVNRQKGNLPRRLLALFNLMDYINRDQPGQWLCDNARGHMDTTLHMLAHCWELEDRPDLAWQLYQQSINIYPTNNIAWVHLIRLFRKYFLREN